MSEETFSHEGSEGVGVAAGARNAEGSPASLTGQTQVAATSFLALFSIVGLALYGLPFYYDFHGSGV